MCVAKDFVEPEFRSSVLGLLILKMSGICSLEGFFYVPAGYGKRKIKKFYSCQLRYISVKKISRSCVDIQVIDI